MNGIRSAAIVLSAVVSMAQTRPADQLTLARRLYNDQKYDEAITRATEAQLIQSLAPAANVVLARARLERFRRTEDLLDLKEARDALKRVDSVRLEPRDRVEYLIGLGESLYLDDQYPFDDRYSAASEAFDLALGLADALDAPSRDRLFDWWALALDRQAQLGPEAGRRPAYQRVLARAERELARDPSALSAAYWLAAAACGVDDVPRAWGAATAAWIHAGSNGPRGTALRDDLDRLVLQVILPERAKQLAAGADARPALSSLETQWTDIKARWK